MGRVEGIDSIQCSGRALVFEGRHTGTQLGIGQAVGTDHSGEERIIVEAGRGLGVDVVLKRSIRCGAVSSLIGNGSRIRGDAGRIGGDIRIVAVDLVLQTAVSTCPGSDFIGNRAGVCGNVRGDARQWLPSAAAVDDTHC